MNRADYTTTCAVSNTAEETFNAINNVRAWWSQNFVGSSEKLRDIFTVTFGETWITVEVVELIPGKQIGWLVTDCHKHWLKDKKEWKGTTMNWEIAPAGSGSQITFTHIGLVPGIECYNGCEKAWGFYIHESLLKLLIEGKGTPEQQ